MRRLAALTGLAVVLAGCSGDPTPKSEPSPTYRLPGRPVRDGETPLPYHPAADGRITFAAIGLRTGISFVVGSHADQPAKGQFVRARVLVDNGYPTFHTIELGKQLLVTTDGATHEIDENGMRIERQPSDFDLGAHDRLEFDLIYDIPKPAKVKSLRLFGAPTNDLGLPIDHDPGVDIPLA